MRHKDCDFLIIGSGAAAMSAALTATSKGLTVLVVEKEEKFGGASARSGGCAWIPGNRHIQDALADSQEAEKFIRNEAGQRYNAETVAAFLENGPKTLEFIEANSPVRFGFLAGFPDYHCDTPGGSKTGRALYPMNWDAAPLGDELQRLRPPLGTGTFMGMQIGVNEVGFYLTAGRKLNSALYVLRCMALRLRDQFRAGRTMRLALGNALIGGLAAAAFKNGMELWTNAPARQLRIQGGRVVGAVVDTPEGEVEVRAARGVMLATGGFPHDGLLRSQLFPHGATAPEVWGMFPYGNSGDGIRMGKGAGGQFNKSMKSAVAFSPLTRLPGPEGALETMPLFFNRGMPGVIAVTRDGKRFCNEGRSYHDFCVELLKHYPDPEEAVAWIIFDHRVLRRYGMGPIYPAPMPYKAYLKNGYLKRGATIKELAAGTGLNAAGLEQTVAAYNSHAVHGEDPEFGRGSNAFDLANGDPEQQPNPCVGPLDAAPYYAIRVFAGCVGTFPGLQTDRFARVLSEQGEPIEGLYASGNDMASITGGDYIAGGCTIGPGLTFGHIVGNHVADQASA